MIESLDLPTPPGHVVADDHQLAAWTATVAGERLERLRREGLQGADLKDAGDALGH
nr:3'(2'),5'-bisphosphate nucleotidase CysQ [Propionibacteriales bacterium]